MQAVSCDDNGHERLGIGGHYFSSVEAPLVKIFTVFGSGG
jgi:hypothetical protein